MFTLEHSPFEFTSGAEVRLSLLSCEVVPGASAKDTLNLKVPGGSRISKKQLEKERFRMVAVVDDKTKSEESENDELDLFSESREQVSPVGHTQTLFAAGSEQSEADNSESQSAVEIAYRIELGINEELKAKMERIRLKLSARYPQGVGLLGTFFSEVHSQ